MGPLTKTITNEWEIIFLDKRPMFNSIIYQKMISFSQ